MSHWTPHDFRRSMSTTMHERLGIQPHIVEACLGHTGTFRSGVSSVYNRSSYRTEKARAWTVWGAHVAAIVKGAKSNVTSLKRAWREMRRKIRKIRRIVPPIIKGEPSSEPPVLNPIESWLNPTASWWLNPTASWYLGDVRLRFEEIARRCGPSMATWIFKNAFGKPKNSRVRRRLEQEKRLRSVSGATEMTDG